MSLVPIGGLSNNGATPRNPGLVSSSSNQIALALGQSGGQTKPPASQSVIPLGSQVGMIGNHTLKSTTDQSGNVTSYNAPKSNPSVLAQQKALNAQGAGLVEDGIAGPKTSAAIAKYASAGSTPTPTPPPTATTPQVGSATENAQTVLDTGNQTDLEKQRLAKLDQAGQMTPEEKAANEEVARANELQRGYQNVQTLSPYAESSLYSDRARTPGENQNIIQAPDLAGRASSTAGLLGSLGNIYGSSRVAGANAALQGIQTAASRGLSAAGTGVGAAQNVASRAQSGAGTVFNSSLVSPTTQGQAAFSPLNGYQGDASSQFGDPNDPASAANAQAYKTYYDQYNAGLGGINAAAASEPDIINTLTKFGLNTQPISAITNLNEILAGQTSAPGQQQLATQVANYIKQLGITPATLSSSIANQQSGTLVQLLNNLKNIATKNNDTLKTTADSLKKSTSSSQNGGSGTTSAGGYSFKLVNGKWVPA